mgnify:CR=1 FL=1
MELTGEEKDEEKNSKSQVEVKDDPMKQMKQQKQKQKQKQNLFQRNLRHILGQLGMDYTSSRSSTA